MMPTFHSTPTSTSTDALASHGYSIMFNRTIGLWFGQEWSRVNCFNTEMTCLTAPMTEAEARAWLAEVAG
jgi:glycerol dehydrogenase-like iron-containing ADH family enzyme